MGYSVPMDQQPPVVQDWLRHIGEGSLATARSHVAAETTADTDRICATVSRDVFFAVPQRTRDGHEIPPGSVLTSFEQVREYYASRADSYVVLSSAQLKSIAGDWYVFNESAASLRGTGAIGDTDAAGTEFVVNSAILFPTAEDGIRGEICVTRHPFDDVVRGTLPAPPPSAAAFPEREAIHTALLDQLVSALRDGSAASLGRCLSTGHGLALRIDAADGTASVATARGRDDAQKVLSECFRDARDVAVVSRLATDWYVFAEYAAELETGGVRRFAATHPVEDGEFTGTFGYGRDEPPAR